MTNSTTRRAFLKYLGVSSLLYVLGVPLAAHAMRTGVSSKGMKIINEVMDTKEVIGKGNIKFSIVKINSTVINSGNIIHESESTIIFPLTFDNRASLLPEDVAIIVRNYTMNKTYIILSYNGDLLIREVPINIDLSETIKDLVKDNNASPRIKRFIDILNSIGFIDILNS